MSLYLHIEGDSISAGNVWPSLYYGQSKGWTWLSNNYAVAGAAIQGNAGNSLTGREAIVAANFQANTLNLLSVEIGANNFSSAVAATNDADMAALAAYCSRMRTRGFYVVVWTLLPRGTGSTVFATFNANRATYNPQYRAMVGVNCHACIDIAADSIMGPDAAANDATLYQADGVHPTGGLGQGHMTRIAAPVLDSFRSAQGGVTGGGAFGYGTRRFRIAF